MSGMNFPLSQLIRVLSLPIALEPVHDVLVKRIEIDSRKVSQGDVFVALVGERVDGHAFVALAEQQGAVAAIVSHYVANVQMPQLLVDDPVLALQQISAYWRDQHALATCMLVTGSNGKTSVKEMLSACLVAKYGQDRIYATQGNLNNHLGLPLSLLSLRDAHQVGVFEVGANHLGEIAQLAPLAQPSMAMITSIGLAHVGEFGGVEAIKHAKGEIFSALPEGGIAIVPVVAATSEYDGWVVWQASLARCRVLGFGAWADIAVRSALSYWVAVMASRTTAAGQVVQLNSSDWGKAELVLPLLGQHQAMNLAAVAGALLMDGMSWQEIQQGLADLTPPKGRLQPIALSADCLLIDDSYNANPSSVMSAIAVLAETQADQKLLVLGDMAELGDAAVQGHFAVGKAAAQAGITEVFVIGQWAEAVAQGFGQGTRCYTDKTSLADDLLAQIQSGKQTSVLVKGSRSSQMESVIHAVQEKMMSLNASA